MQEASSLSLEFISAVQSVDSCTIKPQQRQWLMKQPSHSLLWVFNSFTTKSDKKPNSSVDKSPRVHSETGFHTQPEVQDSIDRNALCLEACRVTSGMLLGLLQHGFLTVPYWGGLRSHARPWRRFRNLENTVGGMRGIFSVPVFLSSLQVVLMAGALFLLFFWMVTNNNNIP